MNYVEELIEKLFNNQAHILTTDKELLLTAIKMLK